MDVLKAENLQFSYGKDPLFSNVGFTVNKGDFIALIGRNGTGKSTLLRLLLGELAPEKGSVALFGEPITRFKSWQRLGYVPQAGLINHAHFPATALEVVRAQLCARRGLFRFFNGEHRQMALGALAEVGMQAYAKQPISQLSGGQLQRVLLARVLVSAPSLLLLDEPTNGVDENTVELLFALLEQQNKEKGLTILMVTHDAARAARHANRVLCLEEGSLLELQHRQLQEELRHRHKHPGGISEESYV